MFSWKFFFLAMHWNFPVKILYYNGDATNEETKVGPKKATGLL